jgi:hypothetical protein
MQFDIRRLDIYRKVPKDLTQPTYTGAMVSLCSVSMIFYLMFSELLAFVTPEIESVLYVDDPSELQMLPVHLDISLPALPCKYIGIDIQDDLGRHEVGNFERMTKFPLDGDKGCRIKTTFSINKVPGNFHVSTHAKGTEGSTPNFKHVIHSLLFGDAVLSNISKTYGIVQTSFEPLNGFDQNGADLTGLETSDYYLKVVPTVYEAVSGTKVTGYQFTASHKAYEASRHGMKMSPAIWFRYQLTPITVKYTLRTKPLYHFITTVCAIVGGTFTVAGIVDSCLFTAHEVFRKMEIGKLN